MYPGNLIFQTIDLIRMNGLIEQWIDNENNRRISIG
jgi:hypothetical protein